LASGVVQHARNTEQTATLSAPEQLGMRRSLLHHVSSVLVLAESHKLRLAEPIRCCPFQKLDLSNGLRTKPNTLSHFLGGEILAPSRSMLVRQVGERHYWRSEMTDSLEYLPPQSWNKAVADASDVHQILVLVIAHNE